MTTGTAAHLADIYARSLMDLATQDRLVEAVAADLDVIATLLIGSFGLLFYLVMRELRAPRQH